MAILSIQSHVSYGYVGNRSAVFPLQRLGFEVWDVNTVDFSNHTGYGSWQGLVLGAAHVRGIVQGIEERGVLGECVAVLSGYLGDAKIGEAVMDALTRVRSHNPTALYCCDPVMGDAGRGFFVRQGIPLMIKEQLLPLADIATPNQFELEALTGIAIGNVEDVRRAVDAVHRAGPKVVLVTSYRPDPVSDGHIEMLVSDAKGLYRVRTPKLPLSPAPNGAGDLTAALFLARYIETGDAVASLELTTDSVFSVLEQTLLEERRELDLIGAQEAIVHPKRRFNAIKL
ncbi:MAG: pyridoxal kinase PdxY [Treponemataceae bacterium]